MSYLPTGIRPARARIGRALREARSLFRTFHCFDADRLLRASWGPRLPEVVVRLGKLEGLIYTSDRGQRGSPRTFIHLAQEPPDLCTNPQGTQLYILGGRLRVTARGIVG